LNINDVQHVVDIAVAGKSASKLYEQNRSFDITVRLPEEKRNSPEAIKIILVATKVGMNIPLEQLAAVKMIEGPVQISRQDGVRNIGVEMNIGDRDIGSFVAEAKQKIQEIMELIVGIDLGTTNSEIAILRDEGKAEVIPIEGEPIMPSCVGIDPEGRLIVGRTAKNQMVSHPDQTVLSIKRRLVKIPPLFSATRHSAPRRYHLSSSPR